MVTYTDRPGLTGAFAGRRQLQLVDDPSLDNSVRDRSFLSGIHSFGYSNGGSFIPYNGNIFSCAVGVPAACLPSGVLRVFLFPPDRKGGGGATRVSVCGDMGDRRLIKNKIIITAENSVRIYKVQQ